MNNTKKAFTKNWEIEDLEGMAKDIAKNMLEEDEYVDYAEIEETVDQIADDFAMTFTAQKYLHQRIIAFLNELE